MEDKSTHLIFDGKKIVISPDLIPTFNFLQEIEREIESLLGFSKKLESIRKQHIETLKLVEVLTKKLKEHSIDFSFTISENPSTIVDKLTLFRPVRSEMIVLFANLETLLCLYIAYKNKTGDKDRIKNLTMNKDNWVPFYNDFCLSTKNEWGKRNPERLGGITADNLRKLRNSLTHFFSVGKTLGISYPGLEAKARKIEETIEFKAKLLSPQDLYEIIKGAARLMIEKWNDDCLNNLRRNTSEFKERILYVDSLVRGHGAVILKDNQINI